ncbi:MAG: SpoIIE family protein phosphatase [Acidobacteria bacterium]|nr:SpoIIE family protein phosphatase [Acidobacteriota bacterium]
MPIDLDRMQWLTLLVWVSLILLYLALVVGIALSARGLRVRLAVCWTGRHTGTFRGLRPLLLGTAVAITAAFLFQVSATEQLPMRLSVVVIGASVMALSLDWGWKQMRSWALRRSAETRDWRLRAEASCHEMEGLFDQSEILRRACRILMQDLGCRHVHLFLVADEVLTCSESAPQPPESAPTFSTSSLLHAALSAGWNFSPLRVFDPHTVLPVRWSHGDADHLAAEQEALATLDARLVVPLQVGLQLEGFFVLGPLAEDKDYGPHHAAFAQAISAQASRLLSAAMRATPEFQRVIETAEAQASARSARATLTHLVPPERPDLADLDFAARQWVGKDPAGVFYDVIALPGRAVALFLAEIPGPAEDASVRLVQLQAILRTRARAYNEDLAELLESTRRALEFSAAGLPPIALFCARYASGSHSLQYVNAGIYPPLCLLQGADGAQVTRLQICGQAITPGEDAAAFRQEEIAIQPGDALAVVSSGIPGALNSDGQTWGELGLGQALLDADSHTSSELADATLAAASAFTAANPQLPPRIVMVLRPRDAAQ